MRYSPSLSIAQDPVAEDGREAVVSTLCSFSVSIKPFAKFPFNITLFFFASNKRTLFQKAVIHTLGCSGIHFGEERQDKIITGVDCL